MIYSLLQERLNASQPRSDLDEKPDKRGAEVHKSSLSCVPTTTLHSRKPLPRSPTPSTSYSKALTPLPVPPLPSPVTALKSEERPKVEKSLPQQPYSHPSSPVPHSVSPASASPSPTSPIRTKEESVEVSEKESLSLQKQPSTPFPSIYRGKWEDQLYQIKCSRFICHNHLNSKFALSDEVILVYVHVTLYCMRRTLIKNGKESCLIMHGH